MRFISRCTEYIEQQWKVVGEPDDLTLKYRLSTRELTS